MNGKKYVENRDNMRQLWFTSRLNGVLVFSKTHVVHMRNPLKRVANIFHVQKANLLNNILNRIPSKPAEIGSLKKDKPIKINPSKPIPKQSETDFRDTKLYKEKVWYVWLHASSLCFLDQLHMHRHQYYAWSGSSNHHFQAWTFPGGQEDK